MRRYPVTGNANHIMQTARPWMNGAGMAGLKRVRGLGDITAGTDETGDTSAWLQQVPTWIQQIQTAVNAQRLYNLNLQRAEQGLPPLSASQYAPQVSVGLSADTQKLLLYGAIGLGVVFFMSRRGRA